LVFKLIVESVARPTKPILLIVTPYLADANNGNWRTAQRWARLLQARYRVIVQANASGAAARDAACMIALHARRSHPAVLKWLAQGTTRPVAVALTGTDLYRDLPDGNSEARASLELAGALIVLQEDALNYLSAVHRGKATVVLQSARALTPAVKPVTRFNCAMVGHLRAEKDPLTALYAWRFLPAAEPIHLHHIGGMLDPELGAAARAFMRVEPRYRWLGAMAHGATRQAIKRAHVLLVPSLMEGGANVVVEALTAGTPVLGTRMSGNVGMLGAGYPGLFPVGDSAALAALLLRCRHDPAFLREINAWCRRRAPLFSPEHERRTLLRVVDSLL
jgi:putative glycosyltransferase (TIGR04348 family)